ncbi:hypothetical protein L202_05588 [Cryptococcus amylolentus CBS 6039]|uniref:Uncharacterized protein n=2 Tax=Cryptococcus amylolentus TaxID=104669 RepID=A0A1E3HL17_9TREE|nr:hypothetical protein L202_05588 [Cryptococcus amylolentus CBS 6039]ODN77047.1 hypothetical protein L202_05588 [Cryptococcus amylolentus CBS 6039]ODO04906.1 hypothetical protein I350_05516 [Cryptococcus amylolentus CBS 6273]
MLAPRTIHTHRTYTHQTTSKKNIENAHALPSKTPSRTGGKQLLAPSTGVRMGLGVKTEGRDRNVLGGQSRGEGGKGKGAAEDIEPKRLFTNAPKSSIPPSKSLSSMPPIPALPTRTPAPRRQAAPSQTLRTPAPAFHLASQPLPAPTPLPSATRTRRRSRQSLSNVQLTPNKSDVDEGKPRQEFVTPAPVRWEEELSLGSIEVEQEGLELVQEEEEDGEPEYMPPPVQELPYDPGWQVPDFEQLFSKLAAMPSIGISAYEPLPPPPLVLQSDIVDRLCSSGDDDLEEDYLKTKPVPAQRPAPSGVPSRAPSVPSRAPSRAPTALSRAPTRSTIPSRLGAPTTAPAPRRPAETTTKPPIPTSRPPPTVPRPPPIRPTSRTTTVAGPKTPSALSSRAGSRLGVPRAREKPGKSEDEKKLEEMDSAIYEGWTGASVEAFELSMDF